MIFCQLICHPMYVSSYALCVYIYIYIHSQQQVGENGNIPSWQDTFFKLTVRDGRNTLQNQVIQPKYGSELRGGYGTPYDVNIRV